MKNVLEECSKIGMIPVIALEDAKDAHPLAKALMNGGLPCAEMTFRTDAAEAAIRIMTDKFPEMLVGAGTVLTTEQADRAVDAGAKFIVSPGFNPKVVRHCIEQNIPVVPGCSNPSDIEAAIEAGLSVVKFFPAEASGGLAAIQAMSAPYHKIKFMPTGGIHAGNLNRYLADPKVLACGGSFMADPRRIKEKDWDGIAEQAREAVSLMLGFTIRHVGINNENEEAAMSEGRKFAALFGARLSVGPSSVFAGPMIEMMKRQGRGAHGHIAIGANQIERAVYHLSKRGFQFDGQGRTYHEDGRLKCVYLAEDIAGFAVHFVENQEG